MSAFLCYTHRTANFGVWTLIDSLLPLKGEDSCAYSAQGQYFTYDFLQVPTAKIFNAPTMAYRSGEKIVQY